MANKSKLKECKIIKHETASSKIFNDYISNDFTAIRYSKPSEYVKYCWDKYCSYAKLQKQNNAMNGKIFELR